MAGELPLFSIIIPTKNAASQIKECLESIKKLNYPPENLEVIVADGLSNDDTIEIAKVYGAKVFTNPKQIVASGRNIGFINSRGEYIIFTDADCTLHPDYLQNCLKYFQDARVAGISGPTKTHSYGNSFERAIKFIYEMGAFFCGSAQLEEVKAVKAVNDIPGCNSVYRRDVLAKVMPFDEKLLTAEDVDLNFRIRKLGYKLLFVPDVVICHHRRSSPTKSFRQIYRFAIGRLQAGKKDRAMINIMHILVGLFFPLFILLTIFSFLNQFVFNIASTLFFAGALLLFLFILMKEKSLAVAMNTVLAMGIAIFAWSLGFLRELFCPLKDVSGK